MSTERIRTALQIALELAELGDPPSALDLQTIREALASLDVPSTPAADNGMISWVDEEGTTHSMTLVAGIEELKALFDEWPCGVDEVEASINSHKRLLSEATSVIQSLVESAESTSSMSDDMLGFSVEKAKAFLDSFHHNMGLDGAEAVCAQVYQVVGSMLSDLGIFESDFARKVLDNLSQARVVHDDVLPWPSFAAVPAAATGDKPLGLADLISQDDYVEGVLACLGDDIALLRDENPESEIALNMESAIDVIERLLVALAATKGAAS